MGKPMAFNLLRAGYSLYIYDIIASSVDELEQAGAKACSSPAELAAHCSIIISILPDSPQVKEVVMAGDGLLQSIRPGTLYIDMSTIDPPTVMDIHQILTSRGVDMLDAPVSGGQVGAETANLSIMVGGNPDVFQRALPLFNTLGKRILHMGKISSGQVTKSCSQIATALATQGVIEAFTLAERAGVDTAKVREALMGGFAQSRTLELSGAKMIEKNYSPGFKIRLYRKDLRIAQETAALSGLKLPGTSLLAAEMDSLLASGDGDLDFSALIKIFKDEQ
jgi:2-hydroxy-3-oxopropionate reductase